MKKMIVAAVFFLVLVSLSFVSDGSSYQYVRITNNFTCPFEIWTYYGGNWGDNYYLQPGEGKYTPLAAKVSSDKNHIEFEHPTLPPNGSIGLGWLKYDDISPVPTSAVLKVLCDYKADHNGHIMLESYSAFYRQMHHPDPTPFSSAKVTAIRKPTKKEIREASGFLESSLISNHIVEISIGDTNSI